LEVRRYPFPASLITGWEYAEYDPYTPGTYIFNPIFAEASALRDHNFRLDNEDITTAIDVNVLPILITGFPTNWADADPIVHAAIATQHLPYISTKDDINLPGTLGLTNVINRATHIYAYVLRWCSDTDAPTQPNTRHRVPMLNEGMAWFIMMQTFRLSATNPVHIILPRYCRCLTRRIRILRQTRAAMFLPLPQVRYLIFGMFTVIARFCLCLR